LFSEFKNNKLKFENSFITSYLFKIFIILAIKQFLI
jgi:hypothetical protein